MLRSAPQIPENAEKGIWHAAGPFFRYRFRAVRGTFSGLSGGSPRGGDHREQLMRDRYVRHVRTPTNITDTKEYGNAYQGHREVVQ